MNGDPVIPSSPAVLAFKDRRTGLIVFGVVEMVLGVLAALMVLLVIFGQMMAAQIGSQTVPVRQIILAPLFYGILAVTLFALGVGSCKARRWARTLSLIVSWSWLAVGVCTMIAMAFFLPGILKVPPSQDQPVPESLRLIVMVFTMIFTGILFVAVPLVLVLFYSSRHVKATCETRDPMPGWTDACPAPVLGLSLWLGFGAVSLLAMPFATNGVLPLFGRLISGVGGSIGCVVLAALWSYCAWATYRLRAVGWWVVLVSLSVAAVSSWMTFTQVDLIQMYREMGYPEQQIEMIKQYGFLKDQRMAYFSVAGVVPILGFLLFVKRYFRPAVCR